MAETAEDKVEDIAEAVVEAVIPAAAVAAIIAEYRHDVPGSVHKIWVRLHELIAEAEATLAEGAAKLKEVI